MTAASSAGNPRDLDARQRARLADIIHRRSFGRGAIRLASGKESDFYFDMKPSMLDPEGARLMAQQILAEVHREGPSSSAGWRSAPFRLPGRSVP